MAQRKVSPNPQTMLLNELEARVREHNAECYWPGPWTLDSDRSEQLIGRADDIDELVYLIRDRSLTVLSGDSGVGKSSLLIAGLIPALRRDGYKTLVCRDWRDERDHAERDRGLDGISNFLTGKFADDLAAHGVSVPDPDQLITQLNADYGSEVVLILDQFEEVIRQQPLLFAELCDWVESVARETQIRVLVSLRSEYAHHLRDLEVGAYRREDQAIPAIRKAETVREIVLSGAARAGTSAPSEVISPEAADLIVEQWVEAGADQPRSRIRLLHLQALLYSIWAQLPPQTAIGVDVAREFLSAAQERARRHVRSKTASELSQTISDRDLAIGVFDWALANVVGVHVGLCNDAFSAVRGEGFADQTLQEGVLHALVQLAEHLSSGGYKVDQEEIHLAELVLSGELRTLGYLDEADGDENPEATALRVIQRFAELTGSSTFDWAAAPTRELVAQLAVMDPNTSHQSFRKDGVTAGALLGTSAHDVLVEECRRFFIALEWLRVGTLIRTSPSDEGRNFVALSHDGFGRGLNEWADANDSRPETALYAITAAFGRAFNWPDARAIDPAVNPLYRQDDGRPRLFVNLRWRSCRIIGTKRQNLQIRNVVFMNCDLRGTTFQYCTLQGVAFVNCLMDGVQFEECRIVGRATALENAAPASNHERELPSFIWNDQDEVIAMLDHYRSPVPESAKLIFSETSGQSVRVVEIVDTEPSHDDEFRITRDEITAVAEKQTGGLVLFGGRLSSLAFYRCDFDQQAEVSLRYVAGTSLDFFEHEGGRVELYDVALRGVTISPPITASLDGADPIHVEFEAVDSHLENVWFSSGLEGTAEIKNSIVWQLFNGSQGPNAAFHVTIDGDSPHLGIVNVPSEQISGPPMAQVKPDDASQWYEASIRDFVGRIDYRSPAENKAYRRRLGDQVDDLSAEMLDEL